MANGRTPLGHGAMTTSRDRMTRLREILKPHKATVFALQRIYGLLVRPYARPRMTIGVRPLSELWADDRGLSIHRYYLQNFLESIAPSVRGRCLEFLDNPYTLRYGRDKVTRSDILHIDDTNPDATIVADLTLPNAIPDNAFDCIICTHVLHVIFDVDKVVAEMHRILAPGGALIVAVPHISMAGDDVDEFWRFTTTGLQQLLARHFGSTNVETRGYGNSLTAAGEVRGLASHHFSRRTLDYCDERFAVEVCARAIKPPASA